MENVIRNMNFKPILEKVDYEKLGTPEKNSTINMRVWDELSVERLRSDATRVHVTRYIKPEPASIFSLTVTMSVEVLINTSAYEELDDPEAYFRQSQVSRLLASHIATVIGNITLHSPLGPMITSPILQMPQ